MACQVNIDQHKELNHVLKKVPRLVTGAKSFSEMAKLYVEKFLKKKMVLPIATTMIDVISPVLTFEKSFDECFDKEPPFQLDELLLSGSWSEGLILFHPDTFDPPDADFLCILQNIHFTEIDQICGNLSLKEKSPFVNAYISDINLLNLWQSYLVEPVSDALQGKICEISSTKLKDRLYENYSINLQDKTFAPMQCNPVSDSPAIKISSMSSNIFDGPFFKSLLLEAIELLWQCSDLVLAINCDGWPRNALEWIKRGRQWPSRNIIDEITKAGFHIVAKSSPHGNFRLSFSRAEGILVKNFNKMQHKVIRAFKSIIKFLIPCNPDNKDVLCSYHLKTIGFWHLEKTELGAWFPENSANHILQMLKELVEALRSKHLPMYFLPEYNLFSNLENLSNLEELADNVERISRDIPALTKAVKMGCNFKFYEKYRDYFKIHCMKKREQKTAQQ